MPLRPKTIDRLGKKQDISSPRSNFWMRIRAPQRPPFPPQTSTCVLGGGAFYLISESDEFLFLDISLACTGVVAGIRVEGQRDEKTHHKKMAQQE